VTTDAGLAAWPRRALRTDDGPGGAGLPLVGWLLALAVAVAFADASIVVLAAPDLLAEFDSTVSTVSWVVTGYNVAILLAAAPVVLLARGRGALARGQSWVAVTALGLVVFLLASLGCATSGSLGTLIWLRAVQGAGGAMLLAGSLPLLARLAGSDKAGLAAWSAAAAVGAALGPAAGGVLTEVFSWRSIFFVQAPLAAAAIVALPRAARAARPADPALGLAPDPALVLPTTEPLLDAETERSRRSAAHMGLALISAALVGALFLVILMMINGWGASPLTAAAIATVLPVGTLLSRFVTAGRSPRALALAGCLTVAGGLVALALVPDKSWVTAGAALAVVGFGLGLAVPTLTEASIRPGDRLAYDGTISVAARHAGLVLALALITPLLASSLSHRINDAIVAGTEAGLSDPVPLKTKVTLATSLGKTLGNTPAGQLPDLDGVFNQVAPDGSLNPLKHTLSGLITTAVTGAFRYSFALCALCALLALVPAWRIGPGRAEVAQPRGPTYPQAAYPQAVYPQAVYPQAAPGPAARIGGLTRGVAVALAPVLALVLVVATARSGGRGSLAVPDPCGTQPAFALGGADGTTQQIALDTLDGAACQLGTSRAALLLTLLPESGQPRLDYSNAELTPAIRHGLDHAVDRQSDDGNLPKWTATALRLAIRFGPVGWLTDQLRSA